MTIRAGCAVTLAPLVAAALSGQPVSSAASASPPADVIVVGTGIAGLSAAWELAQGGAQVVVDMASVFGGHAVMSEGILCLVGTPDQAANGLRDDPDIAYRDLVTTDRKLDFQGIGSGRGLRGG